MAKNGRIKKKNPKIKALRRFAEKDNLKKIRGKSRAERQCRGERTCLYGIAVFPEVALYTVESYENS